MTGMNKWNSIRRVSKKQAKKNRLLREHKKTLKPICCICGGRGNQLMHLLPRSLFPEHYTNPLNLMIGCNVCHSLYDDDLSFRQKQRHLYGQICKFDERGAIRYFQGEFDKDEKFRPI